MSNGYFPLLGNRFTAFYQALKIKNFDMTGRDVVMQIRATPNDSGAPLVDLELVGTPITKGIYLNSVVTETDGSKTSYLTIYIPEDDIEALSADTDDQDIVLSYDIQVGNELDILQVFLHGPFVLQAGVTNVG